MPIRTCQKCFTVFEPEYATRICKECAPRRCEMCGTRLTRANAKFCKPCKVLHKRNKAKQWYLDNKEQKQEYDRQYTDSHREEKRSAVTRYHRKYPDKRRARVSARRARVKACTPPWAPYRDILAMYLSAQRVSGCLSIKHHVDHIIPLKGRLVSGLHVPWNLRVVPAIVNIRKQNHYSIRHNGVM